MLMNLPQAFPSLTFQEAISRLVVKGIIAGWRQNRPLPLILPLFLLTCLLVTAFLRRRTGPVGSIMPCLPVLGSPQSPGG
jgi:hypothetical protein